MDELVEKIIAEYNLTESEALVVIGIVGISAFETGTIQEAIKTVDNKLKTIAYKVAMA